MWVGGQRGLYLLLPSGKILVRPFHLGSGPLVYTALHGPPPSSEGLNETLEADSLGAGLKRFQSGFSSQGIREEG